jgi:hypothetical protein
MAQVIGGKQKPSYEAGQLIKRNLSTLLHYYTFPSVFCAVHGDCGVPFLLLQQNKITRQTGLLRHVKCMRESQLNVPGVCAVRMPTP